MGTIYYNGKSYCGGNNDSSGIVVDDALSDVSTNPVQNKVVAEAFTTKADVKIYAEKSVSVGRKEGTDVGENSIAFGYDVEASGDGSQAFGEGTVASGMYAYAEGYLAQATGGEAHAEGTRTLAVGSHSHAEGEHTTAKGLGSHAEGYETVADTTGDYSHAEGYKTVTSGFASHGEGMNGTAWGDGSHVEGESCIANGERSHAEGYGTIAESTSQHVQGKYNITDSNNTYVHIVGNGTDDTARANAHTLDWNGNAWFAGDVYIGGTSQDDGTALGKALANKADKSDIPDEYVHPSYTAKTGVPTGNVAPAFGGTFVVTQPVSNSTGHITAMNSRTVTIPNTTATTSSAGLMSVSDKTKLNAIGTIKTGANGSGSSASISTTISGLTGTQLMIIESQVASVNDGNVCTVKIANPSKTLGTYSENRDSTGDRCCWTTVLTGLTGTVLTITATCDNGNIGGINVTSVALG